MSGTGPLKVLYIGGWGRSGSTILGKILGQADGFVFSGEIRDFWKRGLLENWKCGCGQSFSACPVWQKVVKTSGFSPAAIMDMAARLDTYKARSLLRDLIFRRKTDDLFLSENLLTLYKTVAAVTGARVIVDSSKFPSYAWQLNHVPGLEVHLLHLVRDPRGNFNSWNKRFLDSRGDGTDSMPRFSLLRDTFQWIYWNAVFERIKPGFQSRSMFLRYEDFVRDPDETLSAIFRLLGEPHQSLLGPGSEANLQPTHTVSGNYNRFDTGPVRLTLDDHWRTNLTVFQKTLIASLCYPSLRKYHYPFRT